MQSSSSDIKDTSQADILSVKSDYSSIHDDDAYTNDTDDIFFPLTLMRKKTRKKIMRIASKNSVQ